MYLKINKKKKIKINIFYLIIKRIFDILIGIIGLVLLIPISIILKVLLIITKDKGPLFYVQKRVGQNGKAIYIYKYRSMVVGAEDILKELMDKDKKIKEEYEQNKKLKNDPRITKVGKFIRKMCIDEMPQFLNLLKGEMSLIGPRPYLYQEIPDVKEGFDEIVSVKPGLTGLWQVSDKSDLSFQRRCTIERYYANNASLLLDIKIFFKTFYIILKSKGTN